MRLDPRYLTNLLGGRWRVRATTNRPEVPKLAPEPREAVHRFHVDSLVHSSASLTAIIDIIGDNRILLGSDWPFPMGAPSADHDLGHLTDDQNIRIRKTNAERLFGDRLAIASP